MEDIYLFRYRHPIGSDGLDILILPTYTAACARDQSALSIVWWEE